MNCRPAPWIVLTLLAGTLLVGAARRADAGETGNSADPPDLLDNRKILEATVAGLAARDSADQEPRADKGSPAKKGSLLLSLPELWARAEMRFPGLQAGRDSVRSARYTRDEQKWLRLPSGELTGFLTWSPQAGCKTPNPSTMPQLPASSCLETTGALNLQNDDLRNYLPLYGALVRIDLRILQPLYTFGKLDTAVKLGEVGVSLAQAAADGSRAIWR